MLLGRLRIRAKLALLVMIPLLAVGALTVPVVLERVGLAGRAGEAAVSVRVASQVGSLAQDLQRERLLAAGFLVGTVDRNRLVLQMSAVSDRITDVRFDLGDDLPAEVSDAIDAVKGLADLRVAVLGATAPTTRVTTDYGTVINRLIGSLRLVDGVDAATDEGRQVVALDALLRADEATSAGATHLALLAARPSAEVAAQFTTQQAVLAGEVARFTTMATVTQISLYQLVAEAFTQRLGAGFTADPAQRITAFDVAALFPSLESFIALGNFVEKRIVTDVTAAVGARERRALTAAYGVAGGAIAVLLLVILLVVSVARAVARPLRRLTVSAERVARLAEEELVRVADDETEAAERVHLDPVDVRARDEIGELARAFERVQGTAARLVERQVASRRNVAEMFGHIGRRTQGLVGRQVGLIDRLEQDESDPAKLGDLYRLDHLSNRLLRNASSLVVLSGADWAQEHTSPLPLADAARLALAKVEDYTRVDLRIPADVLLTPAIIADLVQVMAELMENATAFSPPHTRVAVEAVGSGAGVRLVVTDHGIGLSAERIAEENARLERRERLDLAPTQVLGLFVVGRLARRHGLRVALSPTAGGGVTASVLLPAGVLIAAPPVDPSAGGGLRFSRGRGRPASAEAQQSRGDVLQQLRSILEDGTPSWNAFAISDRPAVAELPAAPEPASQNGLRQRPPVEPRWFGEPDAEPVAVAAPVAAAPAVAGPPAADPGGHFEVKPAGAALHRRSPGATLATSRAPDPADPPITAFDQLTPDEVRDLVEQFEFGVSRAMDHAETGHRNEERQPR